MKKTTLTTLATLGTLAMGLIVARPAVAADTCSLSITHSPNVQHWWLGAVTCSSSRVGAVVEKAVFYGDDPWFDDTYATAERSHYPNDVSTPLNVILKEDLFDEDPAPLDGDEIYAKVTIRDSGGRAWTVRTNTVSGSFGMGPWAD